MRFKLNVRFAPRQASFADPMLWNFLAKPTLGYEPLGDQSFLFVFNAMQLPCAYSGHVHPVRMCHFCPKTPFDFLGTFSAALLFRRAIGWSVVKSQSNALNAW
jgi:hypothetical protein